MSDLADAIKALQGVVRDVAGIRNAPDYPEDGMNIFPYAVAYPVSGRFEPSAGYYTVLHNIVIELHFARKNLPQDVEQALIYAESIPAAIMKDVQLGGKIQTISGITYVFGPLEWGGLDTIGYRWTLTDVKLQGAL